MDEGPLNIVAVDEGGGRRVTLTGEATIYAAAAAKASLLLELEGAGAVDIDLSGVHEVDTTFVQLLLLLRREADRSDKALRIVGASPPVQQLIELYGLRERLLPTSEEAR